MDISIVVPVFNEEAFVKQALTSLLNQTYPAKQLVVVDDGSTDNSVAIIRKLAEAHPNLKLITSGNASCLLYTSPSPRDFEASRMPSSA